MATTEIIRTHIDIGAQATPLIARVNRRAKRLILKVDPVAGEILVTAPSKRSLPEAIAFARERSSWIAGQLDDKLRARPFCEGEECLIRGQPHKIERSGGPRSPIRCIDNPAPTVIVGGDGAHLNRRLTDWLKREAHRDLTAAVNQYCDQLGKRARPIRVRDTRTRWGSCTSDGMLSFSWRLIMAPPEILNYVAAHECAHLIHMDHSLAFWRQVKELGVDARAAENWFAVHGPSLFSYGHNKAA